MQEIRLKREAQHIKDRLKVGKELQKERNIKEVQQNIHLIISPAASRRTRKSFLFSKSWKCSKKTNNLRKLPKMVEWIWKNRLVLLCGFSAVYIFFVSMLRLEKGRSECILFLLLWGRERFSGFVENIMCFGDKELKSMLKV